MNGFEELVRTAADLLRSDFYHENIDRVLNCNPIHVQSSSRDYGGLLKLPELLKMAQLNGTFNFRCSGLSYVRLHPSYVPFAVKESEADKDEVLRSPLTSEFITFGSIFDGPFLCLTHSEEMHLAINTVQHALNKKARFAVLFSRMREEVNEDNPMGSVHPIKAMARRCLTYLPTSPLVTLADVSFLFELCRIWQFPIADLMDRIKICILKKLEDIKFEVRINCEGIARHKDKLAFDRVSYLRSMGTVYIPFPGVVVCATGFPIVKTEFLNAELMPPKMFEWSEKQWASYDKSEKMACFRENGENSIPVSAL